MNETLKEAKRLYDMGFAIIWLYPKAKEPVGTGWTTGDRKDWDQLKKEYRSDYNVGVRLGAPAKIGENYLAVIDVDVKSLDPRHKKEALNAARILLAGVELPMVISGRGNGSRHYYCVTLQPFKTFNYAASSEIVKYYSPSKKRISKRERDNLTDAEIKSGIRMASAWEISLYSDGRQVVLPPSIHPDSGKAYEWKGGGVSNQSLSLFKFDNLKESKKVDGEKNQGSQQDTIEDFKQTTVILDWLECPKSISLLIQKGLWKGSVVQNRSDYLLVATTGLVSAGCSRDDILTILTEPDYYLGGCAYDHAQTKSRARAAKWLWNYTVKKVMAERDACQVFLDAGECEPPPMLDDEEAAKQQKEMDAARPWRQDIKRIGGQGEYSGMVVDTLNNIDLILSNACEQPLFQKDLFANRESYGAKAPWDAVKGQDLSDIDTVLIKSWLANSEFQIEPKKQTIEECMALLAHRNSFHPVQEYLKSLVWDGESRIETWMKDYLGAEAVEPYLSDISRKFLVAMVARVFEPGCQWDYTVILEGNQGTRKSTTARVLAGDKWFCDHLPDLRDKDAMLNLQGSWLVELGELKSIKTSDAATVKSFLTRRVDRVRAPYGKRWTDAPRQSVFIGSVNESEYFKDPTGNRRFWPVHIRQCDVKRLAAVRDQLFAEAKWIYDMGGEELFLSGVSLEQAVEAQDERRVDDDETEMRSALYEFIEKVDGGLTENTIDLKRFKMRDLFTGVDAPWGRWDGKNYAVQNGAQVLRNMRYTRVKTNGQRVWRREGVKSKMPWNRSKTGGVLGADLGEIDDFF